MGCLRDFLKLLPVIMVSSVLAVTPGPDTMAVDENTYYANGYDPQQMTLLRKKHKSGLASVPRLEALVRLDWEIFSNLTKIYRDHQDWKELEMDNFTRSVEEYLEDFRSTSLGLVERKRSQGSEASVVKILATNFITPFLATRRLRNYVRPWMVMAAKIATNRTSFHGDPKAEKIRSDFGAMVALAIWNAIPDIFADSVIGSINSLYKWRQGPFGVHLHISMLQILMPHFIYDMKASDIAKGYIRGRKLGVKLKACHCLDIGVHGIAMALFPLGIEWLEVTVDKIKAGDDSTDLSFAMNWLERAINRHDRQWKPMDSLSFQAVYFSKPLANLTSGEERKWRKQVTCEDVERMKLLVDPAEEMPWHLHWSVCKGDVQQSEEEKSKLFCWYERKVHPVWTIGPLKAELISRFPYGEVAQFYDLVDGDEVLKALGNHPEPDPIRKYAKDRTDNSNPQYKVQFATVRNASKNGNLVRRIGKLAEAVTGLRCGDIRPGLESISYVPGGHALAHEDWGSYDDMDNLHVLVTFMFLIEQPDEGGETSYAHSLVKTNPLKGSAVLSYNLLRSGRKDFFGPHGACPLLFGRKLVLTKDIMYEDQSHLTCGFKEDLRHEILVNGKSKSTHQSQ